MSEQSILFIGGSGQQAEQAEQALRSSSPGLEIKRVETLFDGLRALQESAYDAIVADLSVPDAKGASGVSQLQQHAPRTPVVAICRTSDRDIAVQAVRLGARDFVTYEDAVGGALPNAVRTAVQGASADADRKAAERRNNARFPCRLAVSYQTLESPIISGQGTSETLNISSKGMLFTSAEKFESGQLLQVSLDWPARLENQIPLKLVAEGRVVRNANGQTAMTIEKYEFRTRRVPAAKADSAKKK